MAYFDYSRKRKVCPIFLSSQNQKESKSCFVDHDRVQIPVFPTENSFDSVGKNDQNINKQVENRMQKTPCNINAKKARLRKWVMSRPKKSCFFDETRTDSEVDIREAIQNTREREKMLDELLATSSKWDED